MTSKPDLYPLVISYNAEPVTKSNNGSTGYLMVQYFRNFIVRPVGKYLFTILSLYLLFSPTLLFPLYFIKEKSEKMGDDTTL